MASCNYNCAELPDHLQVDCSEYSLGGVSAFATLDCDHTISDFTSAEEWETNIASGLAKIYKGVKGEVPNSSPVQVDNPIGCGAQQVLLGLDNVLNIKDSNTNTTNDDLYAKLNKQRLIVVAFMCEQNEIAVSNGPAVFTALARNIPEGNRVYQMYQIGSTFFSKVGEIPFAVYDAPEGIFN